MHLGLEISVLSQPSIRSTIRPRAIPTEPAERRFSALASSTRSAPTGSAMPRKTCWRCCLSQTQLGRAHLGRDKTIRFLVQPPSTRISSILAPISLLLQKPLYSENSLILKRRSIPRRHMVLRGAGHRWAELELQTRELRPITTRASWLKIGRAHV